MTSQTIVASALMLAIVAAGSAVYISAVALLDMLVNG